MQPRFQEQGREDTTWPPEKEWMINVLGRKSCCDFPLASGGGIAFFSRFRFATIEGLPYESVVEVLSFFGILRVTTVLSDTLIINELLRKVLSKCCRFLGFCVTTVYSDALIINELL